MIWIKKLFALGILLVSILSFSQEKLIPKVDERVEIVSIVFRLAGAEEYSRNDNKKYAADINTYFDPYKNSEIVEFIRENRNKNGLGYDAVMSMALHLSYKNGKFSIVKEKESSLEKRWRKVDVPKFVSLLNKFYKKSDFQKFFNTHAKEYEKAEKEYQERILSDFNQNWYYKFYGHADEDYKIILGYGNGGGNYGIKSHPVKQNTIVNAVVGVSDFDKDGNVKFDRNKFQPLLIHEFNHSFINYILDKDDNASKLEKSGTVILDLVKKEMQDQAYGNWETVVNESLVRAAVIRYMMDNKYSQSDINEEISRQERLRFLWIKDLVNLLGVYEKNRTQYPTLENFYPEIISFFNRLASKLASDIKVYNDNQPKVSFVSPEIRDRNDVDPATKEITINFNKEMTGKGVSINMGSLGEVHFPLKKFEGYVNDNKAIKILTEMKPNTEYEFILTGNKFMSKDGYPLEETVIRFKTK